MVATGIMLAQTALGGAPGPLCADVEEVEGGGCWLHVENQTGCHIWFSYQADWKPTFQEEANCIDGALNGTGVIQLRWKDELWQTHTGSFSEGRLKDGRIVIERPDDGRVWRQSYMDGKLHGPWFHARPEGERGGVQIQGEYVEGERVGHWVSKYGDGGVTEEHYVADRRQGPFYQTIPSAPRGGVQITGSYHDGWDKEGRWFWNYGDGGSLERQFTSGDLDGEETGVGPGGQDRWVLTWNLGEPHHGDYRHYAGDGSLTATASFVNGVGTACSLPGAQLPPATLPREPLAPVEGGFGIDFGPAGVEQVKGLTCVNDETDEPCMSQLARLCAGRSGGLHIREPPRPIPGGRHYEVSVSPKIGVVSVAAEVGEFDSYDAAVSEERRLYEILREKYGPCRDYTQDFWKGSRRDLEIHPAGNCDERGLPQRVVITRPSLVSPYTISLRYMVLDEDAREFHERAWADNRAITADDL